MEQPTLKVLVANSCPTFCDSMDCNPPGSSVHGISPGKNTGVGSHSFLQGIFLTQGSNLGPLHCRKILYHLSPQGSSYVRKQLCQEAVILLKTSFYYSRSLKEMFMGKCERLISTIQILIPMNVWTASLLYIMQWVSLLLGTIKFKSHYLDFILEIDQLY